MLSRKLGVLPQRLLPAALIAFFVVGGLGNLFPSPTIEADYRRWGYPDWFHFVTGGMELFAAGLMVSRKTRLVGLGLAATAMLSAITTLIIYSEWAHALAPGIVLAFLVSALLLDRNTRSLAKPAFFQ